MSLCFHLINYKLYTEFAGGKTAVIIPGQRSQQSCAPVASNTSH